MLAAAPTKPELAKAERAKRELARRHLIDYSKYIAPWYTPARHHIYLAEKLEQVKLFIETKGQQGIGRLLICEPAQYGKTEQASRLFPSWVLGDLPDTRIILTSYGADLATENSRVMRNYVGSDAYANLFGRRSAVDEPVELSPESRSVVSWNLKDHRGSVFAAGVGGGITGRPANLVVIDDPFKSREDAESETYRRKVMSWYRSVVYPRVANTPGAAIIIMHTRWDQEDLAGQLLTQMIGDPEADQWEVVFLPALSLEEDQYPKSEEEYRENLLRGIFIPMGGDPLGRNPGEALWPERSDERKLAKTRSNMLDYDFEAIFQQMPRMAEGEFFDDKDFQIIEQAPEGLKWYRYVDLALGESKTSDNNSTIAVALDERTGDLILRDRIKVRELKEFLPQVRTAMLSDQELNTEWGFEDVAFQKLVLQQFMKDKALMKVRMRDVKPLGDKVERARPWQLRAKQGHVKLVRGPWNLDFIRESTSFPKGRRDDDVDTTSGGVQMIAEDGGTGKTASSEAIVVTAESLFEMSM
ncbi:MAG TPA: terminase family protein [Anaerolineales bacterium]|nr:terminase family protein [Anaerolineales bacterium]